MLPEPTEIKLVAIPFAGGFEWRWRDREGNEYDFDHFGDMEVDLTGRPPLMGDSSRKTRYMARVTMTLPFEQEGFDG